MRIDEYSTSNNNSRIVSGALNKTSSALHFKDDVYTKPYSPFSNTSQNNNLFDSYDKIRSGSHSQHNQIGDFDS